MEARNNVIYLRVTENERMKIEELAKIKKTSLSSLCRNIVLENIKFETETEAACFGDKADIHIILDKDTLKNIDYYARKSFMSRSAYIARAAIYNTTVIDGLKEFTKEINRLGSNINQIVMLSNQGVMKTIDFREFNKLIAEVINYLIEIKGGSDSAGNRKGGGKEREKR